MNSCFFVCTSPGGERGEFSAEGQGSKEGGGGGGKGGTGTLQKSIDLTPLDPRAGPTGGLGLACPAPTISLTICSLARGGLGAMAQKSLVGRVCAGEERWVVFF